MRPLREATAGEMVAYLWIGRYEPYVVERFSKARFYGYRVGGKPGSYPRFIRISDAAFGGSPVTVEQCERLTLARQLREKEVQDAARIAQHRFENRCVEILCGAEQYDNGGAA